MESFNFFEEKIKSGEMVYSDSDLSELGRWGSLLVEGFLVPNDIKWKLGNFKLGSAFSLKLDDGYLEYLDVYPDTQEFMWCVKNHSDSVTPDDALVYLLERKFGVVVKLV